MCGRQGHPAWVRGACCKLAVWFTHVLWLACALCLLCVIERWRVLQAGRQQCTRLEHTSAHCSAVHATLSWCPFHADCTGGWSRWCRHTRRWAMQQCRCAAARCAVVCCVLACCDVACCGLLCRAVLLSANACRQSRMHGCAAYACAHAFDACLIDI